MQGPLLGLLLIAVGVSMDATAVAAAYSMRGARRGELVQLAAVFGLFQFGMALAGALGGNFVARYLGAIDHWLAFGLLTFVGAKMIWEALHDSGETDAQPARGVQMLVLGLATSLDALAVGVSLPTLGIGAWTASITIGVFTFVLSLLGGYAGKHAGQRFGSAVEVLGGVILILIGLKTLLDHLWV